MPPSLSLYNQSTPLANQVAGHQNVLSDESGSLVIKPALAREIAFYQLLNSAPRSSQLARLKPFVPQFYGTLRLEGQMEGGTMTAIAGEVPESVVLQNLSHAFTHPSILDVKLGTILYAPDASAQKKAKMEAKTKEGTSLETGLRLTGCQTWHSPSNSFILTPKSFGKSIDASQLPSGMMRFFPLPHDTIPSLMLPSSPIPDTAATSPMEPTSHLPLPSVPETSATSTPPSPSYTDHRISPSSLLKVLEIVEEEIRSLISVLENLEMRFIGSSLLIVYEGDEERLPDAIERYEAKKLALSNLPPRPPPNDSDEEEYDSEMESDSEGSSASSNDSLDGPKQEAKVARNCPPVTVKLIDFAHTRLAEGEGKDEGVLFGLNTLVGLLRGRQELVRKSLKAG
ncbi:hypothetical protein P7C73_g2546, partial [Tremellales sp. Uapishka_1]